MKEVSGYRKAIDQIRTTINKSGENLRNWFKMFDENNDDHMEFPEFRRLLQKIGVTVRETDLSRVFELMDLNENGRISYNDFCDVIQKDQILPIEKIVRKRRQERGIDLTLDASK